MTGQMSKKDWEWISKPENLFITEFNLLFTSRGFWKRTPENVRPREEALKEMFNKVTYEIHRFYEKEVKNLTDIINARH